MNDQTGRSETSSKPKKLLGGEVAKAVELLNYQNGSMVAREIVKMPTGSVTIFAFDEGQEMKEHTCLLYTSRCV